MIIKLGYANGRIQAFLTGTDFYDNPIISDDEMVMSQPQRYCSFRFDTSCIIGLHPLDTLIIGVSSHECKVYSKGGMRRYNITQATALANEDWPLSANSSTPEELKANEFKFTCSTLFKRTSKTWILLY